MLLPIILYPLLILGMSQLVFLQMGKIENKKISIAITGNSVVLHDILRQDDRFNIIDSQGQDAATLLKDKKAEVVIIATSEFDRQIADCNRRILPRLTIYYSEANTKSEVAAAKIRSVVRRLFHRQVQMNLQSINHAISLVRPFRIVMKNVAQAEEEGAFRFGSMLALLLVIMAVSFTLYPAIDMAAGEKERGTMETLLISPAHRMEIVVGKYLAIFTIAMIGSMLNLTSMGLTFGQFASMASSRILAQRGNVSSQHAGNREIDEVIHEDETTFWGHQSAVDFVSFTDSNHLVSASKNGQIIVWERQSGQAKRQIATGVANPHCYVYDSGQNFILIGNATGVYRCDLGQQTSLAQRQSAEPARYLAIAADGGQLALAGARQVKIFAYPSWQCLHVIESPPAPLAFSPNGEYLAICGSQIQLIDSRSGRQVKQLPVPASLISFCPDGKHLVAGDDQGRLTRWDITDARQIWPQTSNGQKTTTKQHHGAITALSRSATGDTIASADSTGVIYVWKAAAKGLALKLIDVLPGHSEPTTALAVGSGQNFCLSGGDDGLVKLWRYSKPRFSFSMSLSVALLILAILVPLTSLFAATALALSVFAKSYREAQYYLTPLMIIVMPLAMVALVPAVTLTPGRCFIPVASIVLLYKSLLLGQINWLHLTLVFSSTFLYAALALWGAMKLFEKESVFFRDSGEISWEFWSRQHRRQEIFSWQQAIGLFLLVLVLYYFIGNYLAQRNFFIGHVASQLLFMLILPLVVAMQQRLDLRQCFHLSWPRWHYLFAAVLIAVGGLVIARELSILQRQYLFGDAQALSRMSEAIGQHFTGISPWVLVLALALVPGICEEFFFRGLMLASCKRQMKPPQAVIVVAILFAAMHLNPANFTFYLVLGILLGTLTLASRSVVVAMLAHFINNSIGVLVDFLQPWLKDTRTWEALQQSDAHLPAGIIAGAAVLLLAGLSVLRRK